MYVFDTISDVRFVDGFAPRFDLTIVTAGPAMDLLTNIPAIHVRTFALPGSRFTFIFKAAKWLIRHRRRYDVVFVLGNTTAALAANLAGLVTRRPVAQIEGRTTVEYYITKRDSMNPAVFWFGFIAIKAMVWLNYRLVTVVAPCTASIAAVSRNPNIEIIPWYGIDTAAFNGDGSKEDARRALDLPLDAEIIFYRSRIAPEKDPETFIRAVSRLRAAGRNVVALYVGAEFQEFLEMASGHELDVIARNHVHPLDELPNYYRAADVLVQTSKAEGLALSTLEALACEVPVVASATGGMLETIRPQQTGILVPEGDDEAVAIAVASLLDNPLEAQRLAKGGREMVLREYSAEVTFQLWEQLAKTLS